MDSERGVIEEFLRANPGPFCIDCLAEAVGLPASQVSMVVQRLKRMGAFTSSFGVCSRCSSKRTVVRAA